MVKMFNGFSIKFMGVKSAAEFISVKSIKESERNSKISMLGGDTLSSFKKLLLELIDLLK